MVKTMQKKYQKRTENQITQIIKAKRQWMKRKGRNAEKVKAEIQ